MKIKLFLFFSIFLITKHVFCQTRSPLDDLYEIVEKESKMMPYDFGDGGTAVKAYLEDSYYTMVCEVNKISIIRAIRNNKKYVKDSMIEQLSCNSDFIDVARLLIACKKEMRYIYVHKSKDGKTEIIITRKDLVKMLKK